MMTCSWSNDANMAEVFDPDHPFASGSFRWCAKGKYTNGDRRGQQCVAKWFKTGAVYDGVFYEKDIKAVDKAVDIVRAFNKAAFINDTIYVNKPEVWVYSRGKRAGQKVLVEPFISGYTKYNSNSGCVSGNSPWHQVMQVS